MWKCNLIIMSLFFSSVAISSDFDTWLDIYKNKSSGFYLINVFDGVIAVPNVFHLTSFSHGELILQGIDKDMNNLGLINYTKSEGGKELAFSLSEEKAGQCYGLGFKSGILDGSPMTMVSDGDHVLFISSNMKFLTELMFLPMEEQLRSSDENDSCQFLYGQYAYGEKSN